MQPIKVHCFAVLLCLRGEENVFGLEQGKDMLIIITYSSRLYAYLKDSLIMNLPLVWYDIELLPPNDPPLDDEERENDEDEEEDE